MKNILLIGSYSGQDSFGDKGLLRCVITQFRQVFGPDTQFVSHIHDNVKQAPQVAPDVLFELGISALFWRWFCKLRHLHVPPWLHLIATFTTFPAWVLVTSENRRIMRRCLRDIRACSCLYFYGGTQLSEQWFNLNFPPLAIAIVLCWLFRKPVYFGPQQYGPENNRQRRWLKLFLRCFVRDVRVRNAACLRLLGLPASKLLLDEIYSCTTRFPVCPTHSRDRSFVLINMRGSNFLREAEDQEFRGFLKLLDSLHRKLHLPFKLFQMSGGTFCDDTRFMTLLKKDGFTHLPIEVIRPFDQEHELVELAKRAYGTVSMSFHGCVLSMIGGCPAVPLTSGDYYDHKYIDFDRYTGGQDVPLILLNDSNTEGNAALIIDYFERFQAEITAKTRQRAGAAMQAWYRQVAAERRGSVSIEAKGGGESKDLRQFAEAGER